MGIIFSKVCLEAGEGFGSYEAKIRSEFSGFHLKIYQDEEIFFGVASRHETDLDLCLFHSEEHGVTVCSDGIPLVSAEAILALYLQWGNACFEHLDSDLCCVIYDHHKRCVVAGRDRIGIRPLFYHYSGNHMVISSLLGGVLLGMDGERLNERVVKERLLFPFAWGNDVHSETLYEGVTKLGAARYFVWEPYYFLEFTYWSLGKPPEVYPDSFREAAREFQLLLKDAVSKYVQAYPRIVAEVSGGLDSGAIAAYARRYVPKTEVFGVSNFLPDVIPEDVSGVISEGEFEFASELSDHLGISLEAMKESVFSEASVRVPRLIRWMRGSVPHAFPIYHYPFYEYGVSKGASAIFSGFGGDEFVSSRAGRVLNELSQSGKSLRYYYEYCVELVFSRLAKSVLRRLGVSQDLGGHPFFSFVSSEDLRKVFSKEWCDWLETRNRERMNNVTQKDNERHFYDGEYSHSFQGRLDTCYWGARYFGLTYHFPLLDWKLVSYFHHLPTTYKRRYGRGRALFYSALKGVIPHHLLYRETKSNATLSSGFGIIESLQRRVFDDAPKEDLARILSRHVDFSALKRVMETYRFNRRWGRFRNGFYFISR
jgi:asparagine synthase (glutamine-hydrolysing)